MSHDAKLLAAIIAATCIAASLVGMVIGRALAPTPECVVVGEVSCDAECQAQQALDYSIPFTTPMGELLARFELAGFEVQGVLESLDGVTLFVVTPEGAHPSDVELVVTLEFDPVDFIYMRGRILTVGYDSLFTDLSEGGK